MAVKGDNSALGISYGAARGLAKEADKNEQSFGGNCHMHEKTKRKNKAKNNAVSKV